MPIVWDASYEFWLERDEERLLRKEGRMVWVDELADQLGAGQYYDEQRTTIKEQYKAQHELSMAGIAPVHWWDDKHAKYQFRLYNWNRPDPGYATTDEVFGVLGTKVTSWFGK